MSLDLNKVILGGRLTADPELQTTPSGIYVTTFSVAVGRPYSKDAEKKTDFINCVAWRNTAEFISKYFAKGSSICIVGNIQTQSWQNQNGEKRYATEVMVEEAKFVESKTNSSQGTVSTTNEPNLGIPKINNTPAVPHFEEMDPDDDLPF